MKVRSLLKKYMKSKDFLAAYQWLKDNGLSDTDVVYLKKMYDKEGIKFCKRSLFAEDISELKEELKKVNEKKNRNFYISLLSSVKGVDIDSALKKIMAY
jgi:hypothetical protein